MIEAVAGVVSILFLIISPFIWMIFSALFLDRKEQKRIKESKVVKVEFGPAINGWSTPFEIENSLSITSQQALDGATRLETITYEPRINEKGNLEIVAVWYEYTYPSPK